QVEITVPVGKVITEKKVEAKAAPKAKVATTVMETPRPAVKANAFKETLNEEYLNKISQQLEERNTKKVATKELRNDTVSTTQSAMDNSNKTVNNGFSFAGYAAKFTVFLALVLGAFYGLVSIFKKGVFNKGKLGF